MADAEDFRARAEAAEAALSERTRERDSARKGLFHRITGWDKDGQEAAAIVDEFQQMRDWIDGVRPILERLMGSAASGSGALKAHDSPWSNQLHADVKALAEFVASRGWAALSEPRREL